MYLTFTDPDALEARMEAVVGDYKSFFLNLIRRLSNARVDIQGKSISHICYRVAPTEYEEVRDKLKSLSSAFAEHKFGGREVSEFMLKSPLGLGAGHFTEMVELLPHKEDRTYAAGLENIGVLIGDELPDFRRRYAAKFTGVKDRSPLVQIPYITFEPGQTVKFYDRSLKDIIEADGFEFIF